MRRLIFGLLALTAMRAFPGPENFGVQTTLNKINDVNNGLHEQGHNCETCPKKVVSKYETCNLKNNYFEDELSNKDNAWLQGLLTAKPQIPLIKESCYMAALGFSGGPFQYCGPKDKGAPQHPVVKACNSENYVRLTSNSFETISQCLGEYLSGSSNRETQKESMLSMFKLMTWESGLHVNARAKVVRNKEGKIVSGGSGGSGQLTQGAIADINRNELKLMQAHLETKTGLCSALSSALATPMKPKFSESCDRISLSAGNPLKNMAYAVAYQKQSRRYISKRIGHPLFTEAFGGLSVEDRDYLERNLAMWSHNTGDYPVQMALRDYLLRNVGKVHTHRSEVDLMLKQMIHLMRPHVKGRYNPEEPVQFYKQIEAKFKILERNAGDGTCLAK